MTIITLDSPALSMNTRTVALMQQVRARGQFLDWVQEDTATGEIVAFKVSGEPIRILKQGVNAADPRDIIKAAYDERAAYRVPHTLRDETQSPVYSVNGQPVYPMQQPQATAPSKGLLTYLALLAGALFIL